MCDKKTVEEIQEKDVGIEIRVSVGGAYVDCKSKSAAARLAAYIVINRDYTDCGYSESKRMQEYEKTVRYINIGLCPCCWDRSKPKTIKGITFEVI